MFRRLLPQRFDNLYQGQKPALWLFALAVFMRLIMSLNSVLNGRSVVTTADGIPIDTYAPAAAQTIVSLFSLLGFASLMLCLLSILSLARYRSMVPLMFALLLLQSLGAKLILWMLPIARTGKPVGVYVNLVLLSLLAVGLALSLWRRDGAPAGP